MTTTVAGGDLESKSGGPQKGLSSAALLPHVMEEIFSTNLVPQK
jgi:hypothetical protein